MIQQTVLPFKTIAVVRISTAMFGKGYSKTVLALRGLFMQLNIAQVNVFVGIDVIDAAGQISLLCH